MENLFDFFEGISDADEGLGLWAARPPRRPRAHFDIKLVPRTPNWREDPQALDALERIREQSFIHTLTPASGGVQLRLEDDWIATVGAALEAGGDAQATFADLTDGKRFSIQFWDANATKALHVGHLRNLAIGNAISAALTQAGARVERRSLISDAGRSMGEAMAGIIRGARSEDEKSDHYVGNCYSSYVASTGVSADEDTDGPEFSHTREVRVVGDTADELVKQVMQGDEEALELWFKTRAWVIAGQRKTLSRLGIYFDKVFFESDFLAQADNLMESGLEEGWLVRREDGVVVYPTGLEDLQEMPLVRPDGQTTQYMRSLAYCVSAPELEDKHSMQVCGAEWVSHAASIRKLVHQWKPTASGFHPSHSIFHGMVGNQKRAISSSEGGLLIDDLIDWLERQIQSDRRAAAVCASHPHPEGVAAQVALGYFLPYPVAPRVDFELERLLRESESFGWEIAATRARPGSLSTSSGYRPVEDPDYRFAVVQSEIYRRHLRLAVERYDVTALALYLRHLARWYTERDRNGHIERVVHTLLDRGARGLGLEGGR